MPRPPRTRAAPRRAAAAAAAAVPAVAKATEPETQPANPSSDIYNVSDREKEAATQRRRSARISSGPNPVNVPETRALRDSRKRRDSAMDRLENMTSTESITGNDGANDANRSDESLELSRRDGAATPLQGKLADLSGLDLDDSMFDDLNTTFNTVAPASAGPASTSRLKDSSTITASSFKRRPRAGSFLSRDDGPIRPSSRAGPNTPGLSSTFNIGNFKRRAREPSILGTAQKPRARHPSRDIESDIERGLEDDDSEPEAVSTPFKLTKRQSGQDATKESSTEQRASRKRKSTEGHAQRRRESPVITADQSEQSDSDADGEQPSLPPMPSTSRARQGTPDRPSTPGVPSTPVMDEELMAPPLSTDSSEGEDNAWPPISKGRTRRPALRRTPTRADSVSDLSSPPSLTHSPNYAPESSPPPTKSSRAMKRKVPPTAAPQDTRMPTTAALTGLLPRRRQRNARADDSDDEQVDLSGLGDNDDELTHLDVRTRRRPARAAARGQLSSTTTANKRNAAVVKATAVARRKSSRTYGRLSDKENEVEEEEDNGAELAEDEDPIEEDSQMIVERLGEELKQAARKFQEVDKWSLEYEEVIPTSSPRGGR